ncbi:MAG: hypothetical protein HQM16_15750 [Deltaproteobacteria bacterium]|nr:hypothetical protein [Deltaproteobacteria bacterium]
MTYNPLNFNGRVKSKDTPNPVTKTLKAAFDTARHEIWATTNFIHPVPEIKEALINAARRGVKVRIVTTGAKAGACKIYSDMPYVAAAQNYQDYTDVGIEIYETKEIMGHGKMYIIDDRMAGFGSYNLETSADTSLFECLVFTHDKKVIRGVGDIIRNLIKDYCRRFDPVNRNIKKEFPVWKRFFAKFFAPLYI